ncbi:hypothetical protein M758_1G240900 [Ceratodon purpureus]|nr:hypothetical protein M758_1G240900 [Ceratodon purpureus]
MQLVIPQNLADRGPRDHTQRHGPRIPTHTPLTTNANPSGLITSITQRKLITLRGKGEPSLPQAHWPVQNQQFSQQSAELHDALSKNVSPTLKKNRSLSRPSFQKEIQKASSIS